MPANMNLPDDGSNTDWRYAIGSLTEGLKFGDDGGLEILLQHQSPEPALQANRLPTPAGKFNLFLRTYLPGPGVTDQSYAPPPVRKIRVALAAPTA